MRWEDDFRAYLKKLDEKKPVVLCGDLNVAHEEIDLKNPKTNHFNAGFTDQERGKFSELLGAGFIDTFRYFYPDRTGAYSWWSYIGGARSRNAGWRIDYFVVSRAAQGPPRLRDHPRPDHGQRPLPGGTGAQIGGTGQTLSRWRCLREDRKDQIGHTALSGGAHLDTVRAVCAHLRASFHHHRRLRLRGGVSGGQRLLSRPHGGGRREARQRRRGGERPDRRGPRRAAQPARGGRRPSRTRPSPRASSA